MSASAASAFARSAWHCSANGQALAPGHSLLLIDSPAQSQVVQQVAAKGEDGVLDRDLLPVEYPVLALGGHLLDHLGLGRGGAGQAVDLGVARVVRAALEDRVGEGDP